MGTGVVIGAVVVVHGVVPWVPVSAVEPEPGEESERAEGQEEGGHAERGASTCGVWNCCAAAVVSSSAVYGCRAASGSRLAAEIT